MPRSSSGNEGEGDTHPPSPPHRRRTPRTWRVTLTALRVELPPELVDEITAEVTRRVLETLDGRDGRWLTGAKAAASYLGCSPRRVYARLHEIPHVREGGRLMFSTRELDEWLRSLG